MPRRSARLSLTALVLSSLTLAGCTGASTGAHPAGQSGTASSGEASAESGNQLVLLGLGDSITGGTNCDGCTLFVDLVARDAAQHLGRPVQAVNRGEEGYDSNQLLGDVQHDGFVRKQIGRASIVLVMIGINDANCPGPGGCSEQVHRNVVAILTAIHQIRGSKVTAIRVIDYYNFSLGDPNAPPDKHYQSSFRSDLARLNDSICHAARDTGAVCVDLVPAFNGSAGTRPATSLLSLDHLHPAQQGHRVIAKLIEATGYAPLH